MPTLESVSRRIVAFLEHPSTVFFVAAVLVWSGVDELLEEWTGSEGLVNLDVHHGVILFGLQRTLIALGDMIEGMQKGLASRRKRKREAEG
jgi:hypothetical protein